MQEERYNADCKGRSDTGGYPDKLRAKRETEITRLCEEIEKATTRLTETIDSLIGSLELILRPSPPAGEKSEKEQPPVTLMGQILVNHRNRINVAAERLRELRQRIEL